MKWLSSLGWACSLSPAFHTPAHLLQIARIISPTQTVYRSLLHLPSCTLHILLHYGVFFVIYLFIFPTCLPDMINVACVSSIALQKQLQHCQGSLCASAGSSFSHKGNRKSKDSSSSRQLSLLGMLLEELAGCPWRGRAVSCFLT